MKVTAVLPTSIAGKKYHWVDYLSNRNEKDGLPVILSKFHQGSYYDCGEEICLSNRKHNEDISGQNIQK